MTAPDRPVEVAIYGAGQAGTAAAALLGRRPDVRVVGPLGRADRERALTGGADVVMVTTTSFLEDVAPDIRAAVEAGSNVITSAEEAAYPWATSAELADELDGLARARGVTILGAGLNPGLAFDALVLTAAGATPAVAPLTVERVVDLSGFGRTVLRRIGVGHDAEAFAAGARAGQITGHIGFRQSMWLVAARLGVAIERMDHRLTPILAEREHVARHLTVPAGATAGFEQEEVAYVDGRPWFTAHFVGHVDPASTGRATRDEIRVGGEAPIHLAVTPGIDAQRGSAAVLANSVGRVLDAPAGWLTVAEVPPATPAGTLRKRSQYRTQESVAQ